MVVCIYKVIKFCIIICLLLFSFFYLKNIKSYLLKNNDIIIYLKNNEYKYYKKPINAIIKNEYIIPGINGKRVDIEKTFYSLETYAISNSSIKYKIIKPNISLSNNKNKVIINGNRNKREISFIINNTKIMNYLNYHNISYVTNNYNYYILNKKRYNINYIADYKDIFKLYDNNYCNNLSIILNTNYNNCKENNIYLIKPTINLSNQNYKHYKDNISSGNIIYINNNFKLENLILILKEVKFRNYKIILLNDLIKE